MPRIVPSVMAGPLAANCALVLVAASSWHVSFCAVVGGNVLQNYFHDQIEQY